MKVLKKILLVALLVAAKMPAQSSLTTTFSSNNGQYGVMFDVVATQAVTVCSFDVNLEAGTWTIEVYSKAGGFGVAVNDPVPWGPPIAVRSGFESSGLNTPSALQLSLPAPMAAGSTRAFYITATEGPAMRYTTGAPGSLGSVFAQDANVAILVGTGVGYPFSGTFSPRIWNGTLHYSTSSPCPPPLFQTNHANSSVDFAGVQSSGNSPAITRRCTSQTAVLHVTSPLLGRNFELGATLSPLLPRGAPGTSSTPNQTINLDGYHPSLAFLNGTTSSVLLPFPGSFSVAIQLPISFIVSVQMGIADPSNAEGFSLSQGAQLNITAGGVVEGPTEDDEVLGIDVTAPPLCRAPVTFFGVAYPVVYVSSNGRISMVAPDDDFSPTLSEALTDDPFLGCWSDFDPSSGGEIRIEATSPGRLDFLFDDVAPFAAPAGTQSGFALAHESAGGTWTFSNLSPLTTNLNDAFFGLSQGNLGASNQGAQTFAGTTGTLGTASAMLYEFGPANQLTPVVANTTELIFTPAQIAGQSGYGWSSN